jgi:hypothetical protein
MMPAEVLAHCDGMDGPVVKAAQRALAKGNVNLALICVQANDEPEIRKVFAKTMAVRKLNAEARELADLYFFETLVRIHRAGEGAPYTGLKPAGRDLGPAIPAADNAIETGAVEPLVKLITSESANGIRERFQKATAAKKFNAEDVKAGREANASILRIFAVVAIENREDTPRDGRGPLGGVPDADREDVQPSLPPQLAFRAYNSGWHAPASAFTTQP